MSTIVRTDAGAPKRVTADPEELGHGSVEGPRPAERRPDLIGRGAAVGYTGAYREPGGVDIQDVVAAQTARGPE